MSSQTFGPAEVIDARIDVHAQYALLRMRVSAPADASAILAAVKAGELAGIYKEDEAVPAARARRMGIGWWQLMPTGEDAALVLEMASPPAGAPLIVFRDSVRSVADRLDPALLRAWRAFQLLQAGTIVPCVGTVTRAIPNIVPPIFCPAPPPTPLVRVAFFDELVVPVFIIPGIMGTRLADSKTGAYVWNPTGFSPSGRGPAAANLDRLENPAQLVPVSHHDYRATDPDRLRADSVGSFGNLVPEFYDRMCFALAETSFQRELRRRFIATAPVIALGYDWRQDNRETAARLKGVMIEHMERLGALKCVIVAHSMGGLIARWLCTHLRGDRVVQSLVLIGSPAHGSPQAYRMLKDGVYWITDDIRPLLGLFPERTIRMLRTFSSVYQLLPTRAYCQAHPNWIDFSLVVAPAPFTVPVNAADPDLVYGNPTIGFLDRLAPSVELVSNRLARRREFDVGLGCSMPPGTSIIFSAGVPTEDAYRLSGSARADLRFRIDTRHLAPGDGTVPEFSASARGCNGNVARVPIARGEHGTLCNHTEVIPRVQEVVRGAVEAVHDLLQPGVAAGGISIPA